MVSCPYKGGIMNLKDELTNLLTLEHCFTVIASKATVFSRNDKVTIGDDFLKIETVESNNAPSQTHVYPINQIVGLIY